MSARAVNTGRSAAGRLSQRPGPRYSALARLLTSEIASGRYRVGDRIPTEAQLQQRFDVSRHTIREALRESPEYGAATTMSRGKAEDIVRRAYLSVLRREPDSGSSGFVEKVLHDNWTQVEVERELFKSSEYRRGRR